MIPMELQMEATPRSFPRASIPAGSRGRRRPPTTGEYTDYAKALREANEAKRRALDMEEELAVSRTGLATRVRLEKTNQKEEERRKKKRTSDGKADAPTASHEDGENLAAKNVSALRADAKFVTNAVIRFANTSNNFKGTYIKELKVAANEVRKIVNKLGRRVALTGDVSHLQAENARLKAEVDGLRGEVRASKEVVEAAKERLGAAPGSSANTG